MLRPPFFSLDSLYSIFQGLPNNSKYIAVAFATLSSAHAAVVDVYFLGGQSNATSEWALAATTVIQAENPRAEVVWINKQGAPLFDWFEGGRQANYLTDFYDPDPVAEGALEARFNALTVAGHTPQLAGVLWFQGESDQYHPISTQNDGYYDRFLAMRDQIMTDFSLPTIDITMAVVDGSYSGPNSPGMEAIRAQQFALGQLAGINAVDSAGYERSDGIHLTLDAQRQAGTDMAQNLMSVPEPGTAMVASLGVCALLRRRRLQ